MLLFCKQFLALHSVFRLILSLISHLRVRVLSVFSAGIQDAFCLSPSVLILFNEGFYYFSSARCNRTFGKTGLGNGWSQGLCLHKKTQAEKTSQAGVKQAPSAVEGNALLGPPDHCSRPWYRKFWLTSYIMTEILTVNAPEMSYINFLSRWTTATLRTTWQMACFLQVQESQQAWFSERDWSFHYINTKRACRYQVA